MKTRSFEEIWQDTQKLKGTPVYSLDKHLKSDVIDVDATGLIRRSEKTRRLTLLPRSAFERTWEKLTRDRCCGISESWKQVCHFIALLPEVEYSLKPGKIWIVENKHKFGELVAKK
jgi:hypothetical protein